MFHLSKIITLLLFFSFIISPAYALEEIIRHYRGARSLGMGGVVTTTGLYDEALFGNPAMQLEDDTWKLSFFNLTAEANANLIGDIKKLSKVSGGSGADTLSNAAELVGRNEHARLSLLPLGFYSPRFFTDKTSFALALLINANINLMVRSDLDIETLIVNDIGPAVSVGHKFLDDSLNIGVNVRYLYRLVSDSAIQASSLLAGKKLSINDFGSQGGGLDADIGAYYKIPYDFFGFTPSVGLSINDMFRSDYGYPPKLISAIKVAPPTNDRTVNIGGRVDFPNLLVFKRTLVALEMHDFGVQSKLVSFWKKFHMGAETRLFFNFLMIRAGINQGYPGGGVGLDLPLFKIDVATYGEELGSNVGQLQDRRYLLRFSMDL